MIYDVWKSRVYAGIHYTYSCVEGKTERKDSNKYPDHIEV